jgi:hypothetical protein
LGFGIFMLAADGRQHVGKAVEIESPGTPE